MTDNSAMADAELCETIRFMASLVSTDGVEEDIKKEANQYLRDLIPLFGKTVKAIIQSKSDIQIVNRFS